MKDSDPWAGDPKEFGLSHAPRTHGEFKAVMAARQMIGELRCVEMVRSMLLGGASAKAVMKAIEDVGEKPWKSAKTFIVYLGKYKQYCVLEAPPPPPAVPAEWVEVKVPHHAYELGILDKLILSQAERIRKALELEESFQGKVSLGSTIDRMKITLTKMMETSMKFKADFGREGYIRVPVEMALKVRDQVPEEFKGLTEDDRQALAEMVPAAIQLLMAKKPSQVN